jgi:hypothetical protein
MILSCPSASSSPSGAPWPSRASFHACICDVWEFHWLSCKMIPICAICPNRVTTIVLPHEILQKDDLHRYGIWVPCGKNTVLAFCSQMVRKLLRRDTHPLLPPSPRSRRLQTFWFALFPPIWIIYATSRMSQSPGSIAILQYGFSWQTALWRSNMPWNDNPSKTAIDRLRNTLAPLEFAPFLPWWNIKW